MSSNLTKKQKISLNAALSQNGLRSTKQRSSVYSVILAKTDHPTADDVLTRVRKNLPTISLATVYNCLETLVETKLIRQVNFEREPTRYCPNLTQHAHFYCRESGDIVDIELPKQILSELMNVLPKGFSAQHIEIAYDGKCNDCHDAIN